MPRENGWRKEHGLTGRFIVMHSGNIGFAQDLDTLIRASTLLRDLDDLETVLIGTGARLQAIELLSARLAADSVKLLPYQSAEVLASSLSAADIHFVGLAPGLAGYVVPSRIYGIMAAARPMVVSADARQRDRRARREGRLRDRAAAGPARPRRVGDPRRTQRQARPRRDGPAGPRVRIARGEPRDRRRPLPRADCCAGGVVRRWVAIGAVVAGAAVVLVVAGRYENAHAAKGQMNGMAHVLALVGPNWATSADAYRMSHGFDCLLYKSGPDPFALELCFDQTGRLVSGIDRRTSSPKFWTLQFDPSESTIRESPAVVTAAFIRAGAIPKGSTEIPVSGDDHGPVLSKRPAGS